MLSRTADCLYWMARYTERAENTARMLDVNHQTSLLPQPSEFLEQSWKKLLTISKLEESFLQKYDAVTRENVLDFMIYETSNPSSIVSCLFARENARVIRGRITSEAWETQNTTWLELQRILEARNQADPSRLLEWVKHRCHLFRGVMHGTMLKNEAFYFMNVGTLLERADNTARILETKYEDQATLKVLRTDKKVDADGADGDFFDFYHWAALLRSVSAFEIYRQIYSDQVTPKQVAELLIFNKQMPRSLVSCVNELIPLISEVKNQQSKEIERLLGKLKASLDYSDIDEVFSQGLEEFIEEFLERINHIADEFSNAYLIPLAVA